MIPKFDRINIEISNICNLKCSFCPAVERGSQVMECSAFGNILSQVGRYTKEVVLHLLGEPLGHPNLGGILSEAQEHRVPVNIVTNGVLMMGEKPALLLHPTVRQVSFSLHSFEANFPDRDPTTYIERLCRFVALASEQRPDLYINFRFWDLSGFGPRDSSHNKIIRELLSSKLGFNWDDVVVNLKTRKNWRIAGRTYLHFDSRFEWPSKNGKVLQEFGTCHALKGHIGIHADGTVVPCCLDHNGDMPLGNIFQASIESILNSPRAVAMRQGFNRGELVEPLCKTCGFIERFSHKL